MLIKSILAFATLSLVFAKVGAASFDCSDAITLTEHTICKSVELSEMDDLMISAYKNSLASSSNAGVVQNEQKKWLSDRNRCTDYACVAKSYQTRLWQMLPPHERGEVWAFGVFETNGNRIDIIQTKPHEIYYRLSATSPSGNMGEIEGKGQIYDGIAKVYDKANDCKLTFIAKSKTVAVTQTGYCGFGMNVTADGEYQLATKKSPYVKSIR